MHVLALALTLVGRFNPSFFSSLSLQSAARRISALTQMPYRRMPLTRFLHSGPHCYNLESAVT